MTSVCLAKFPNQFLHLCSWFLSPKATKHVVSQSFWYLIRFVALGQTLKKMHEVSTKIIFPTLLTFQNLLTNPISNLSISYWFCCKYFTTRASSSLWMEVPLELAERACECLEMEFRELVVFRKMKPKAQKLCLESVLSETFYSHFHLLHFTDSLKFAL